MKDYQNMFNTSQKINQHSTQKDRVYRTRTDGAAERAESKALRTVASASPTYDDPKTSAGENEKKATPEALAAALARVVFAHPGGP